MPDPTPTPMVTSLFLDAPWSDEQMRELATLMGARQSKPAADRDPERLTFVGERSRVEFFTATRSFRWRAQPGAAPRLEAVGALAALRWVIGQGQPGSIEELFGLQLGPASPLTALQMPPSTAYEYSTRPSATGAPAVRRQVGATTHEVGFAWRGTPIAGARAVATLDREGRLLRVSFYWGQMSHVGPRSEVVSHDELDRALRCKGLGRTRWATPPTIVYRLGYPHRRQLELRPLYRLQVYTESNRAPMRRGPIATFYSTAEYRPEVSMSEELSRRMPPDPYLGEVVQLHRSPLAQ